MTEKVEIGEATLYHGNCLDTLPGDIQSDLILTDPPYGVEFKSNRASNHNRIANDHHGFDVAPYLEVALKTLVRGRHIYVFGAPDISGLPLCSDVELIWDKENKGMGNLSIPWGPQHEKITFAIYQTSKANRKAGFGKLSARLRKGSVLRSLRPNAARAKVHPNEKPVDILRQMIESSSVLGETVLDPFMGSGSTGVAALLEGRKFVGIELDRDHFNTACDRMSAAQGQQRLFA